MQNEKLTRWLLVAAGLVTTTVVTAADLQTTDNAWGHFDWTIDDPVLGGVRPDYGYEVAGFKIRPKLAAEFSGTDNAQLEDDDDVQDEAEAFVFRPAITAHSLINGQFYALEYRGAYGYTNSSSDDNYSDNELKAQFSSSPRPFVGVTVRYGYLDSHDLYGERRTEGSARVANAPLDKWQRHHLNADLRLSHEQDNWYGGLRTAISNKTYKSNETQTQFLDYKTLSLGGSLYRKLINDFTLVMDLDLRNVSYDQQPSGADALDALDFRWALGLQWDRKLNTNGYIKAGIARKNFDDGNRQNYSSAVWDARVDFEPYTFQDTKLSFVTNRFMQESYLYSVNVIARTQVKVSWEYSMSERSRSLLGLRWYNDEYETNETDEHPDNRIDNAFLFTASFSYDITRYITGSVGLNYKAKDSGGRAVQTVNADYEQAKLFVTVEKRL